MSDKDEHRPGLKDRLTARFETARARYPMLDHAVSTFQHYSNVQGSVLAGAVTYFGFLSFFPVLALAFAAIGYVALAYPGAEDALLTALQQVLPGLVGDESSSAPIKISTFTDSAATASVFGAIGLLYSGLGWLSGLREALQAVFAVPPGDKRNLVVGKGIDLVTLIVIGTVLLVSVGLSSAVSGFLGWLLDQLGLADVPGISLLLGAAGVALGIAASTVLFFVMFRLLPQPDLPNRALLRGALFGAIAFEVLKLAAAFLISSATQNPAFALLGVSLVLLVWINYFSRVALLAAAWAAMSVEGRPVVASREVQEVERIVGGEPQVPAAVGTFRAASTADGAAAPWPVGVPTADRNSGVISRTDSAAAERTRARAALAKGAAAGAAATAALLAILRRRGGG
ncbi:MAG: YihY/virulence factor BrkB family protein [Nocardioidaceae bacterium]|nr:YihY/virulence factor BrkB family protein [Nocardioidaceae bacterium]